MKLKTTTLLPSQTRVLLREEMRRKLFSDKKSVVSKLGISLTQVHNWKIGKNNPSREQLQKLGINLPEIWKSIENFNLERGKCKVKLPREINIKDCSWLIGVNEGDGVNKNRVLGLTNQNKELIGRFITEINKLGVLTKDLRMTVKVNDSEEIIKSEVSKEFGIEEKRIEIRKATSKINKTIFQVFVPSRIIHRIFKRIFELMKSEQEPKDLAGFVQGFLDAEGCVTNGSVKVSQKDVRNGRSDMEFIHTILTSLNIRHSFFTDKDKRITIRLSGGKENLENLRKFKELISFSQPEKLEKLNSLINSFKASSRTQNVDPVDGVRNLKFTSS